MRPGIFEMAREFRNMSSQSGTVIWWTSAGSPFLGGGEGVKTTLDIRSDSLCRCYGGSYRRPWRHPNSGNLQTGWKAAIF